MLSAPFFRRHLCQDTAQVDVTITIKSSAWNRWAQAHTRPLPPPPPPGTGRPAAPPPSPVSRGRWAQSVRLIPPRPAVRSAFIQCCGFTSTDTVRTIRDEDPSTAIGKIQGDGRKFLDRFKSYFGSQISSQSLNEVHICRLQPKSVTKGDFFSLIYYCLWLSVPVGACCPLTFYLVSQ